MALTIGRGGAEDAGAAFVAMERLCLDETRERVVPCEGDEARWLLAGEGQEVPAALVARYGLSPAPSQPAVLSESEPEPEPKTEPDPKPKRRRSKAVAGPPEDKGA